MARPMDSGQPPVLVICKSGLALAEAPFPKDSVNLGFAWGCDAPTSYKISLNHLTVTSQPIKVYPRSMGLAWLFQHMCPKDL